MKEFDLVVVTPEHASFRGKALSLLLPAWEGSLGVLGGHAPALILLKEGEVRVKTPDGQKEILSLSGGFAEIAPHQVTLFAETAEMAGEIDAERAKLAAERAKEDLAKFRRHEKSFEEGAVEKAQAALRRALTRLKVAQGLSRIPRRQPPPIPTESR